MEMGAAIAAGADFLKWEGKRKARVMFLDGELPVETLKERMELIAKRYGKDLPFYGYNREDLGFDGMPPLNTDAGQRWLRRETDAIKPDLIIFDSIMCLLIGSMSEESTWMPMRPFIRELSTRRIAQIWNHHANDHGRAFGDKTREWEMDTVAALMKPEPREEGDSSMVFEFRKTRLRKPDTAVQFLPLIIYPEDDGWRWEGAKTAKAGKSNSAEKTRREFLNAYNRLTDGVTQSPGFDGALVAKVKVDDIRDEMKRRGSLPLDEKKRITPTGRTLFFKAKEALKDHKMVEADDFIWRK